MPQGFGCLEQCVYGIRELSITNTNQSAVFWLIWTNERSSLWPDVTQPQWDEGQHLGEARPEVLVPGLGELVVQLHLPAVLRELGEVLTPPVSHHSCLSLIWISLWLFTGQSREVIHRFTFFNISLTMKNNDSKSLKQTNMDGEHSWTLVWSDWLNVSKCVLWDLTNTVTHFTYE